MKERIFFWKTNHPSSSSSSSSSSSYLPTWVGANEDRVPAVQETVGQKSESNGKKRHTNIAPV